MTQTQQPDITEDELPMIVSVDDHVVEPPHVWETWLPREAPSTAAPTSSAAASAT